LSLGWKWYGNMVRRQFETPPNLPATNANRCLIIPDSKEWLGIFNSALLELAQAYNYEQVNDTDMTPEDVAAICFDIYTTYLEGTCTSMECQEVAPCLYPPGRRQRMNPTTGRLEFSDDGATWYDASDYDPRYSAPRNELSGVMGCDESRYIVGYIQHMIDRTKDQIEIGGGAIGIAAGIVGLMAAIFSFGAAIPVYLAFAGALVAFTSAAITAALTDAVWQRLACNVLSVITGETTISDDMFAAIVAQMQADETGTAETVLWHALNQLGPVGLQNVIGFETVPTGVDADCSVCGTWCYEFDFHAGQDSWTIANGFWSALKGFYSYWDGSRMLLEINRTYTDTVINRVVITGTIGRNAVTAPTRQFNSWKDGVATTLGTFPSGAGDFSVEWTGTLPSDRLQMRLDSNSATSAQENRFYTVRIEGTGDNPFGADNC